MRRLAVVLAFLALAGCGDAKTKKAAPVQRTPTPSVDTGTRKALDQVDRSNLPADAKKELKDAAKLLDGGG